ncbi:hypothetical protein C0J52_16295 [Blattella germanica]|nr:hypothetical protein C0J52_16295 [Blattella germanica]
MDGRQNKLQAYADQEWSAVQALIAKLQDTVNKGKTFASSSTQQIAACASNFFGSLSCYASLAGPILQQAASIGIDIANLAVQSQDAFKIALTDLQTSFKTIGSQTTTQATAIISEAAQCITSRSG